MTAATLPTVPLIPVLVYERPLDTIPPEAKRLYLRRTCDLVEACAFLGLAVKKGLAGSGARNWAQRYWERVVQEKPGQPVAVKRRMYDPDELKPLPDEIPVAARGERGKYIVDTHLLVWSRYPVVSPW